MKESCLKELIACWERNATPPTCEDGSDEAKLANAKAEGFRHGIKSCVEDLKMLIHLLGGKS